MSTKVKKIASRAIQTPRFWDLHLHGVAGIDFMHASRGEMDLVCRKLGEQGIGFFAPTLLTSDRDLFECALARWGQFLEGIHKDERKQRVRKIQASSPALPVGLHLEGPFLNPEMAGAHPKGELVAPSVKLLEKWLSLSRGWIAILTLAPELPGASEVIRWARKRRIHVQLGHTKANGREIEAAIRAGAAGVTHLFNAMRIHHREPGVLPHVLRGELTAELICDGVHVHPDYLLWALSAAGGAIYAVTDACSALGAPKGARCTLGDMDVRREGAAAIVARGSAAGTLAGGATWLTTHPRILAQGAGKGHDVLPESTLKEVLGLFYEHQKRIVLSTASGARLGDLIAQDRARLNFDRRSMQLVFL